MWLWIILRPESREALIKRIWAVWTDAVRHGNAEFMIRQGGSVELQRFSNGTCKKKNQKQMPLNGAQSVD